MEIEEAANTLQSWWRLRSVKHNMENLRLGESRESFEQYADLITSKSTQRVVTSFLRAIGIAGFPVKMYLAAFMIFHWGDEVTGMPLDKCEESPEYALIAGVRHRAERVVRMHFMIQDPQVSSPKKGQNDNADTGSWETKKTGVTRSSKRLELLMRVWHFKHVFDKWKRMDKDSIVNHMIYNYKELDNCRALMAEVPEEDSEVNKEILDYIHKQQLKIRGHVEQLAGKDTFVALSQNYKSVRPSANYSQVREVMQKAFWDKIAEDLEKIPPSHQHTLALFDEIKTIIRSFIPRRHDLHDQMETIVDLKFMDQMIKNGVFDHSELMKVLLYLVDLIGDLQPPIEDRDTQEWRTQTERSCKNVEAWNIILPMFFKRIFKKLDGIRDSLKILSKHT